jgi:predicted HicB family RNase H-like nuclease
MMNGEKRANCYPLRLPSTLRTELEAAANGEGISINQFIAMAVAEKIILLEMHPPEIKKP